MMRRAFALLLPLSALVTVAAIAYVWANALVSSVYGYRSPIKGAPPVTQDTHQPLTSQVVVLLIDGLRYDTSLQMPYLNTLRQQGAHAKLIGYPPSNAQIAWTTLVSGATPEINDAPLFDRAYEWLSPVSVDHIFGAVNRAGLTAGIVGSHYWEKLIPGELLYTHYSAGAQDDAGDRAVIERAITFIQEFHTSFLLVQLQQIDTAGYLHGGSSWQYREAALRCDAHIRALSTAMDLRRSVLIVASSYGHLDAGGHGGAEAVVLHTPLVMAGESTSPGNYDSFGAEDLAPTISALLGCPTPASAQGRIRSEMLRMGHLQSAEKWVALARQRIRFGNIYLGSIAGHALRETAEADMLVAISSLEVQNYQSAAELARLSVQECDLEMAQARTTRIWRERWSRAGPIALAAFSPLALLWFRRSRKLTWSALAALFGVALYHFLFVRQGNSYSFSQVPADGFAATLTSTLQRAAVTLAAGSLIVVWHARRKREYSIFGMIMDSYVYSMMQVYWIGLVVGACALWNGLRFSWYLPNFTVTYVHIAGLLHLMAIAVLAIPLPLLTVPLCQMLRALTRGTRRATEPDRRSLG